MIYIGIDPGSTGAIGIIHSRSNRQEVYDIPIINKRVDFNELATILTFSENNVKCFIEKSQPMPGQGVVGVFNYGIHYGFLLAALISEEIPYEEITPQLWKKEFDLIISKEAKAEFSVTEIKNMAKARSVETAMNLFPKISEEFRRIKNRSNDYTLLHGRAEAILIAEYCRRKSR